MPTTTLTCGVTGSRQFSTIQAMFDELDNGAYVSAGDDVVCELYDDGAFDEDVVLDNGSTIGLASITVRPAAGHEHDGAQGTGVRIVRTSTGASTGVVYVSQTSSPLNSNTFIDDMEVDGNGQSTPYGFRCNTGSNAAICFRRCMAHDTGNGAGGGIVSGFTKNSCGMDLFSCMAWDVTSVGTSQSAVCIDLSSGSSRPGRAINCSAIRATSNSGTGSAVNIAVNDHTSRQLYNCVGALQSGTSSGTKVAFGTTSGGALSVVPSSHNAADDTSAPDVSDPGTAVDNITPGDCFVETTLGMVDLHIVAGCDLVGAGVDATTLGLSDIPGIELDIERTDRTGLTWDIGAHQYVATGGGGNNYGVDLNAGVTAGGNFATQVAATGTLAVSITLEATLSGATAASANLAAGTTLTCAASAMATAVAALAAGTQIGESWALQGVALASLEAGTRATDGISAEAGAVAGLTAGSEVGAGFATGSEFSGDITEVVGAGASFAGQAAATGAIAARTSLGVTFTAAVEAAARLSAGVSVDAVTAAVTSAVAELTAGFAVRAQFTATVTLYGIDGVLFATITLTPALASEVGISPQVSTTVRVSPVLDSDVILN